MPADPTDAGLILAQQLATAYADGDWETARRISPLPAWDDATYEEGFGGLEASTVFLGGTDTTDPTRLGMYLMQVAHETRPTGDQTSLYCVRWDLQIGSSTIDKIAGNILLQEPGFTPPADAERGAWQCTGFDQRPDPAPVVTPAPPTAPSPRPAAPGDDPIVITYRASQYACEPTLMGFGDYNCMRYLGGNYPAYYSFPDLRCSDSGLGFDCTTEDYYPSELEGYEIAQIDGERVLCRWNECWIWDSWESPGSATIGSSDFRCTGTRCEPS